MTDRQATLTERPPLPTASGPWDRLERTLQSCIDAMEQGEILIISRRTANQFVQLFHCGCEITMEATSNGYIVPPPFLLDRRQYKRAIDMGWIPPTIAAEDLDESNGPVVQSPNFHLTVPSRTPLLAHFLLETLRRVYKIRTPRELQYRSFEADDGTQIKWPTLGLGRYTA